MQHFLLSGVEGPGGEEEDSFCGADATKFEPDAALKSIVWMQIDTVWGGPGGEEHERDERERKLEG